MSADRGTRVFWKPTPAQRGRGHINTLRIQPGQPPDFAAAGAPCTRPTANPEAWFPVGKAGAGDKAQRAQQARYARQLCQPCRMQAECLAWANTIGATAGIWGGVLLDGVPLRDRRQGRIA